MLPDHFYTYKATMMATERQQRMTIAAMIPSASTCTWIQEQEEEKSKMYPVEQAWMV